MKSTFHTLTTLAAISAAALVLSGCDTLRDKVGGGTSSSFTPRPTAPNVLVVNGVVVLDQDPLVFGARGVEKTITWRLDPKDPQGFNFNPNGGITIEGRGADTEFRCGAVGKPAYEYRCINRHTVKGKYNYTIRLLDRDGKPIVPVDPVIHNL